MNYHKHYSTRETPQSEPIPGRTDQVKNNAGGYVWAVDDWKRLERFLVLGSEGGSYYVGERELTIRNASAVARCIDKNGPIVVEKTVEISKAGRAPKNDSALFVLAMCAGMGSKNTRRLAFDALPEVARIFTHLALFNKYLDGFRGWGRGRRNANANWYNGREVNSLAYQAIKYRKRHGWTHRDLLRMSHPTPVDKAHEELYHWITQGEYKHVAPMPDLIDGLVVVQSASNEKQVIAAI
jgi:60 kDa SS-A/Ro ribonucleoprotein